MKHRLSADQRADLYETISLLTANGKPAYEAIKLKHQLIAKSRSGSTRKMAKAMGSMKNAMASGSTLSASLKGVVPDAEINLISAGERGDSLPLATQYASEVARNAANSRKKLIGVALYPVFLVAAIIGMLAFFGVQIFPIFEQISDVRDWPEGTQFVYRISVTIEYWLPFFVIGAAAFGYLVAKSLHFWVGDTRKLFDVLPPYNIFKLYSGGVFLITISGLMQAGLPFKETLDKVYKQSSSLWLRYYIKKMLSQVGEGVSPGNVLSKKMFPEDIDHQIIINDRASAEDFSRILGEIGRRLMERGDAIVAKVGKMISLFGMLFAGSLMGYMFINMFMIVNTMN